MFACTPPNFPRSTSSCVTTETFQNNFPTTFFLRGISIQRRALSGGFWPVLLCKCLNTINEMIQMDDVGWEFFLDSSRSCGSHLGSASYLECPKKMGCGYSAAPGVCFSGSAEQERGSPLLFAALLIDQPATTHLAEAKSGLCDISLRYRRHP